MRPGVLSSAHDSGGHITADMETIKRCPAASLKWHATGGRATATRRAAASSKLCRLSRISRGARPPQGGWPFEGSRACRRLPLRQHGQLSLPRPTFKVRSRLPVKGSQTGSRDCCSVPPPSSAISAADRASRAGRDPVVGVWLTRGGCPNGRAAACDDSSCNLC